MKLTKSIADKASITEGKSQAFIRDEQLKGFALRVTKSGAKSFVVEKRINGKVKRITLGRYGELTVEQARKEAQKLLGQIAGGADPVAKKQEAKARAVTLSQAFNDYLKTRKSLKPKTLYDYNRVFNLSFSAWHNKALITISKNAISKMHAKLGEKHGHAYANLSMRVLRALFNFAASQYEDAQGRSLISDNPVKRLSQTRAWYRVERRQTFIKPHELNAWHDGVQSLESEVLRDYLLLIMFTGLRREEAASLSWNQVDFKAKTLTIKNTKNRKQHTLPLSGYLYDLLLTRRENATTDFVFPGTGKSGYVVEPRKQIAKAIEHSGVHFTIHDLRRTFITIAESLDIPAYALKHLLNHSMAQDVTAGYIVMDVERLRGPMEKISVFLLKAMRAETLNQTKSNDTDYVPFDPSDYMDQHDLEHIQTSTPEK